jgi:hypothetical protein
MAKPGKRRRTRSSSSARALRRLAAAGIAIALVALLMRLFDHEIATLVAAGRRTGVVLLAQATGLAAVVLGFAGLWRREPEALCGGAIVLGAVAMFFDFFLFAAFVSLLAVIGIAVYRVFYKR